jgi:hypothetical protein
MKTMVYQVVQMNEEDSEANNAAIAISDNVKATAPPQVLLPPTSPSVKDRVQRYEARTPEKGGEKQKGLGEEKIKGGGGGEKEKEVDTVEVKTIAAQMLRELRAARKTGMLNSCPFISCADVSGKAMPYIYSLMPYLRCTAPLVTCSHLEQRLEGAARRIWWCSRRFCR